MVAEEMRNVKVAGYGKWTDLASYIYEIVDYALSMRDNLTVIFICHSETISDDNGMIFTRIKTNVSKLDKIDNEIENDVVKVIDALEEF